MSEPEFFYDIEQGTTEWHEIRRGIPTASVFDTILAGGKGADKLLDVLTGEVICGQISEGYQNYAMARGKEMEQEARERFVRKTLYDVRQCGFVRREIRPGRFMGCSPDGLFTQTKMGLDAVLEIKTMRPDLMIAVREGRGSHPEDDHYAQVQGAMWVTGYPAAELMVWYRGVPWELHYTIARDETYIRHLAKAVTAFDKKLQAQIERHSK